MTVLDDELNCVVLGVHISHFSLEAVITHNRWREDDSKIFGRHLIHVSGSPSRKQLKSTYQVFTFSQRYASEMEYQKLETVAMLGRKHVKRLAQMMAAFLVVLDR